MALIALLLGQAQKGTRIARDLTGAGLTASIFLDATLQEGFSAPSEVTQHPVETGAEIGDNIVLKSQKLTIHGIISETPYSVGAQIGGVVSTVASRVGQAVGGSLGAVAGTVGVSKAVTLAGILKPKSVTNQTIGGGELVNGAQNETLFRETNHLPGENIRLRDAVAELMNIRASKRTVNIITGLKVYKNFVMTGCEISRNQKTGQAIEVSLEFMEVRITSSETVKIAIPSTKKAVPEQKEGRLNAIPSNDNETIAYGLAKQNGLVH